MTEAEMREGETERCFVADFEDGGRGDEPRNAEDLQKLEKEKKKRNLQKDLVLVTHFGLLTYRTVRG